MKTERYLGLGPSGFHRLAYYEWGDSDAAPPVVCVHGLTRTGRDFDAFAEALAGAGRRVVAVDVAGRGQSDWLTDPDGYGYPQYLADMTALVARLDAAEVDWVGTSMGGLIGMLAAAQPKNPIRRMVINDVGPLVPKAALQRIAAYVGEEPRFEDVADVEAHLRRVHEPFGDLSDAQWAHLARHSARSVEAGKLALHYDPGIAKAFQETPIEDVDLWAVWDSIACPTMVLRGAKSDLLLPETAADMARRGPKARVETIEGCGHAPVLMDAAQIELIRDWLSSP